MVGVQNLVSSKTNKLSYASVGGEGIEGEPEDELSLKLSDEELITLATNTESSYAPYYAKIKLRQQKNLAYYLGAQKSGSPAAHLDGQSIDSNILWEVCETFLAAALAKNPEPVVYADNSDTGNAISGDVKTLLQYHASELMLRQKMKQVTRYWMVDLLGVGMTFWNDKIKDMDFKICDVKDFIFDTDGYVDAYGDFVGLLGRRVTLSAKALCDLFPKHKEWIMDGLDSKAGTQVTYTEWGDDDIEFSTYRGKVLDKSKNPNFNYGKDAKNHFAVPKKKYTFLSVYSFGKQPHDVTNIIEQNIPNQNRITRRTEQLDYNISKSNNSDVFSKENFNQEEAKQASMAMAKGNPILVPSGRPISEAIHRMEAPSFPAIAMDELENSKNDLRSIAGTQGITSQSPQTEPKTARGMILQQQYDSTRIGGSIGEALEVFAKGVFNQLVQGYYVYYDDKHYAQVLGTLKAVEYVQLSQSNLSNVRLTVTVSPDSMKPKDELTVMNQALTLWEGEALDIKTLLTILDFPDPQETAAQVWLWQTDKKTYGMMNFPELTQEIQQFMAMQQASQTPQAPQAPQQPSAPQSGTVPPNSSLASVPLPR